MTDEHPTLPLPSLTDGQRRWLDLWAKSEEIAMHFNQLIVTFRLRALAAIGVAGGLIGTVLLNEKTAQVTRFNYVAFAGAMFFIAILWLAVWAIDLLYYHRLLLGAVAELLRLERESNGVVRLSTSIGAKAERGWDTVARTLFYALPLAALITTGVISYKHAPSEELKAAPVHAPATPAGP